MFGEREVILGEKFQVTTAAYLLYDAVSLRSYFPTFQYTVLSRNYPLIWRHVPNERPLN